MARGRTADPLPMSYDEWKAQGYPSLMLSAAQMGEWSRTTRMNINHHTKSGKLFRYDDGPNKSKYPTDDPRNLEWLISRDGYTRSEVTAPGRPAGLPRNSTYNSSLVHEQQNNPREQPRDSAGVDMLDGDVEEVLETLQSLDLTKLSAAAVQKVQRLESALKTRVEREAKRGLLIERSLVSVVFARLYQVDSNELRTLGSKVSSDIAGELGVEDPATVLSIEKRIDDEVLKILAHIKRIMDDFLVALGGEPVPPA